MDFFLDHVFAVGHLEECWWAKQGEEPLDLLLVRQNYGLYRLLQLNTERHTSILKIAVILLDVPWALYTRLQHATLRFVLLCYLCATFYCAAYETRLPKPVINRSLSLPSTTQQQIFQYFQPVRRPMQEYVLSISIFKQPRPLSSRIASPAGITLVLHRASSLGNI